MQRHTRRYQSYQVLSEIDKSCAEFPHVVHNAAHPVHTTVNVVPHAGSTASTRKRAAEIIAFCDRATGRKATEWYW